MLIDTVYKIRNDTIVEKSNYNERHLTYSISFQKNGKPYQELFVEDKKLYIRVVNYGKNERVAEEDF